MHLVPHLLAEHNVFRSNPKQLFAENDIICVYATQLLVAVRRLRARSGDNGGEHLSALSVCHGELAAVHSLFCIQQGENTGRRLPTVSRTNSFLRSLACPFEFCPLGTH